MIYCFDKELPFEYTEAEMALAKRDNKAILYDSESKAFYDFDSNVVDINGMVIFPRTGSTQVTEMNNEIVKHGGIPVLYNDEIEIVDLWPKYVELNRKVEICSGRALLRPSFIDYIERTYGEEFFFKTKNKDFSDVIDISLLKSKECAFYRAIENHLDDEFIISEAVEVLSDELGIEEYRVFVEDGRIMNISRMTTEVFHKIPSDVIEYVKQLVSSLKNRFPKFYCVDVFRASNKGCVTLDVSEFNPIHCSGPYLYNSVVAESKDLEHNNIRNIAFEFASSIDECRYEGPVINNRDNTYKIPNSFSSDLRSLAIQGFLGLEFTSLSMTKQMYANTKPLHNFSSCIKIESDEQLTSGIDYKSIYADLLSDRSPEETDAIIKSMNKLLSMHKDS